MRKATSMLPQTKNDVLNVAGFLKRKDAPKVMTTAVLGKLMGHPEKTTLQRRILRLVETGCLHKVMRGLYINGFQDVHLGHLIPYIVPGGYLSLNSVLGEEGIANNPIQHLQVVVPVDIKKNTQRINSRLFEDGTQMLIYTVPERFAGFGINAEKGYNRATAERALCDWLYLARSPRSRIHSVPDDLDLSGLNKRRLHTCAKRMGVMETLIALEQRIQSAESYYEDASSLKLPF